MIFHSIFSGSMNVCTYLHSCGGCCCCCGSSRSCGGPLPHKPLVVSIVAVVNIQPPSTHVHALMASTSSVSFVPSNMNVMCTSTSITPPLFQPEILIATIVAWVPVQIILMAT